jgi:hypothetical protein
LLYDIEVERRYQTIVGAIAVLGTITQMAGNSDSGGGIVLAILAVLAIYNCSGSPSEDVQLVASELGVSEDEAADLITEYGSAESVIEDQEEDAREPFDEDAAKQAAEDDLASESYDYSYGCTSDCSGHEAGWRWRADNGYTTPGNSNSFYEGGQAFDDAVDNKVEEMRNAYEAGEEPY